MSQADCEETNLLFGISGTYNATFETCTCPDGFSGIDMFHTRFGCHVGVEVQYWVALFSVVTSALTLLALLIGIVCLIPELRTLKAAPRNFSVVSAPSEARTEGGTAVSKDSTNVPPSVSRAQSRSGTIVHTKREAESHRMRAKTILSHKMKIFCVYVCFALYFVVLIPVQYFHLEVTEDGRLLKWILYSLSILFYWYGAWLFLYTYYTTLPDVIRLATLLQIDSVIVRYPTLVQRAVKVHYILWTLYIAVTILVAFFVDIEQLKYLVAINSAGAMLVFVVFLTMTCLLLEAVYSSALEMTNRQEAVNEAKIKRALGLVRTVRRIALVLVFINLLPAIASVWYTFLAFAIMNLGALNGAQLALYAFSREPMGMKGTATV